jgi:ssDNA-binding Zn-finger/Zn-ribbon topoisomerase 1
MLKACYCRGTNENCHFCYGRGYMEVKVAAASRLEHAQSKPQAWMERCPACGLWVNDLQIHKERVHDRKATPLPRRRSGTNVQTGRARPKPRSECPDCGKRFKNLALHRAQVHGSGSQVARQARQISTAGWVTCPECNLLVKKLARHRQQVHGIVVAEAAPAAPTPAKTELVRCPDCNIHVRADRLERHQERAHGPRSTRKKVRGILVLCHKGFDELTCRPEGARDRGICSAVASARQNCRSPGRARGRLLTALGMTTPQNQRDRELVRRGIPNTTTTTAVPIDRSDPYRQERHEREQDASRDYAQTYREHGRFGSHPLHDDYGDEADA